MLERPDLYEILVKNNLITSVYWLFDIQKQNNRTWETVFISSFSNAVKTIRTYKLTLQNHKAKKGNFISFFKEGFFLEAQQAEEPSYAVKL